jgi:uncharacterized membrane protein
MNSRAVVTDSQTGSASTSLRLALAGLIAALILVQALLAGEWLAGKDVIRIHQANGFFIVLLAVVQTGVVAGAVRGSRRTAALLMASLFLLLVALQLALGLAGYDSVNQARALHIVNGVLLFGLACGNVGLALPRSASDADIPAIR